MERKKLNIWTASSFFIFLTYLVFLVYPIVTVLKQALIHEGQFSLANFVTFFGKAYYSETLVNSFKGFHYRYCHFLSCRNPISLSLLYV